METLSELGRYACQSLAKDRSTQKEMWLCPNNMYFPQIQGMFQRKPGMRGDWSVSFNTCFILNTFVSSNKCLQESFGYHCCYSRRKLWVKI